jgi:hypothetical protein
MGTMGNIVALCQDPCLMARIACKDPLQTTGRFEAQQERLFGAHRLFQDCQGGSAAAGGNCREAVG